jgi:hypothetical protein
MGKAPNIVEARDLKPLQHVGHTFNKALVDTFTEPNSAKISTLTVIRKNEGLVVEAVIKGKNEQI